MKTNDATRATAQALSAISRRRFLLTTTMAGAAVAVAVPMAAAEPTMTLREEVIWHIRELERLTKSTGAGEVTLMVVGHAYGGEPGYEHCKSMLLQADGTLIGFDDIFAQEGGAA